MAIISISGRMGHGKDTVGLLLNIMLNNPHLNKDGVYDFYRKSLLSSKDWHIKKFADKLKDITCILLGCTREQLEYREFKEKELGEEWSKYIKIQTDTGKKVGRWFNSYEECGKTIRDSRNFMVGTFTMTPRLIMQLIGTECGRDILHPNIWVNALMSEYKPEDNWIITDTRFPNELQVIKDKEGNHITLRVVNPNLSIPENEHESETALDNAKFDYIIINDGSIEDLIDKLKVLVDELFVQQNKQ